MNPRSVAPLPVSTASTGLLCLSVGAHVHHGRSDTEVEHVATTVCIPHLVRDIYSKCDGQHWSLPYFGVMKATFKPPTDLLHPILPVRCNGKLKFPLCYKCACTEQNEECSCSDVERIFTGTYCTPEIEVAINEGYEIVQAHEVLHWKKT